MEHSYSDITGALGMEDNVPSVRSKERQNHNLDPSVSVVIIRCVI